MRWYTFHALLTSFKMEGHMLNSGSAAKAIPSNLATVMTSSGYQRRVTKERITRM